MREIRTFIVLGVLLFCSAGFGVPFINADRFDQKLKEVIAYAINTAREARVPEVTSQHLLYAVTRMSDGDNPAVRHILTSIDPNIDWERFVENLRPSQILGTQLEGGLSFGVESELVLTRMGNIAGTSPVSSVHLLEALAGSREVGNRLTRHGATAEKIREMAAHELVGPNGNPLPIPQDSANALEKFTRNLTRFPRLEPVIGRVLEVYEIMEILGRRIGENNVFLLGDAGVGKTALVEMLGQLANSPECPEHFRGTQVLTLDLARVMAGASAKGQFEERVKNVIEEIKKLRKSGVRIVLFLDEGHTMSSTGGGGSMDLGNLIKPELSRGEIPMILATTNEEFQAHIKDPAVRGRFGIVNVAEFDKKMTANVLHNLVPIWESHYGIDISPESIDVAVTWSVQYGTDVRNPRRAISIVDRAASQTQLSLNWVPIELRELRTELALRENEFRFLSSRLQLNDVQQSRLEILVVEIANLKGRIDTGETLHFEVQRLVDQIKIYRARMTEVGKQIETHLKNFDSVRATALISGEMADLKKQVLDLRAQLKALHDRGALADDVLTPHAIARVVSKQTNVPVNILLANYAQSVNAVVDRIRERVVGQDPAIELLARILRAEASGTLDPRRPVGVVFFPGTTGTGKTELAKALAELTGRTLVNIKGENYREKHQAARLFGAPPGFVGYEEGGELSNKMLRNRYAVVLIDEIEKMHLDALLQLMAAMDEGFVTDGQGRLIDFRNSIIIFASNTAQDVIADPSRIPRDFVAIHGSQENALREYIWQEIGKRVPPEFLGRLKKKNMVVMNRHTRDSIKRIVKIRVDAFKKRLLEGPRRIRLEVTPEAIEWITRRCLIRRNGVLEVDHLSGGRGVEGTVEVVVDDVINKILADGNAQTDDEIRIDAPEDTETQELIFLGGESCAVTLATVPPTN